MALDSELLDRFERDWNDALAHYEARTTASRLADTSVAPWARTSMDPEVASGIQDELFGPLQAKWDILREGARGRSSAAAGIGSDWSSPMNIGGGEVVRFNDRGEKEILNQARPRATSGSSRAPAVSVGDRAVLGSLGRMFGEASVLADDPNASPAMRQREQARRDAIALQMKAIEDKYKVAPPTAFDPNMFASRPEEMMRPLPNSQIFMGDPMAPAIQDPPPAPLPGGPSVQRSLRILNIRPTGSR